MPETLPADLAVLRYGELFLKGANRHRFEQVLVRNVRRALADLEAATVERAQGRLFVTRPGGVPVRVLRRLSRVFGLTSVSAGHAAEPDLEALCRRAVEVVRRRLERAPAASFRVTTKRSDKQFPVTSVEVNRQVGAAVAVATGLAVDLEQPDLVVGLEIGPTRTFIHLERIAAAGGLPVGVSGHVGLLLSGGIDSPVAGHLMQKRGCVVHPIYFHSFPYTSERSQDKVRSLAARLLPAQGAMDLLVVPFTNAQVAIRDHCPRDLAVVLYRRMMVRIACNLARRNGCRALATGDSLGQVASQTLENLACVEDAADLPVLRPLLTYDKAETIALARSIDTYQLSIEPYDDCCSLFVPRHPATRASARAARSAEASLDLDTLVGDALAGTEAVPVG